MLQEKDFEEVNVLNRLQKGDEHAFLEIYDHYKKPLYTFIIKFVKIPAHADDILQDVFLKIWEVHARINTSLSFKAYLYRISRNLVYKFLKKAANNSEVLSEQMQYFIPDAAANAEVKLQWKEYEENINAAIDQLPPRRKEIFILCRQGKHTYDDVAKQLGISRNTVKEHMVLSMKSISSFLNLQNGGQFSVVLLAIYFL